MEQKPDIGSEKSRSLQPGEETNLADAIRQRIEPLGGVELELPSGEPTRRTSEPLRFVPEREKRISGITHVVYEYANLMAAAYYSIHGSAPWRTNCDDAFLLGCRKLDDFLMKDKRTTRKGVELDDVLAVDYLPERSTRGWTLPLWGEIWREPMNKQLAHIAYDRTKEWNHVEWVPKLREEFRKAWGDFRKAVTDATYKEQFESELTLCRKRPGFAKIEL